MSVGPIVALAAVSLLTACVCGWRWSRAWLVLTLTGATASLLAAGIVLGGAPDWEWCSGFALGGERLHLRLDGVSALFLALLATVGGAGAVYSREYWGDRHQPRSAGRGRVAWSALVLSMAWVLVSSNALHFLLGWELFTICAFFLITLDSRRRQVRKAGWLYLAASHTGTVFLFAFFVVLADRRGTWDLGPMREQAALAPLFWLCLVGFGVKAGFFPLHVWLPSAHGNAPSHVSAILSGVAIKMGIYGIVRFSGWMPLPAGAGAVVVAIGVISAVLGIAFALAQNDLKRLLAYCSVENIGVIMIGLGGALLAAGDGETGPAWGRLALAGAFLHVWNHGLFKSLLFLCAGSVLHATGTREMSRLGGLWRTMPWTAGLFALGAVAVSGLPPLNGFVGEWLIYLGLFDAVMLHGPAAWAAMPAAILMGAAGALALATFIKAGTVVFMGAPRTRDALHAHECGTLMRGPMIALAGVCVVAGLAPFALWPLIERAVGSWNPAWAGAPVPASMYSLAGAHAVLALSGAVVVLVVLRRSEKNGVRRALTWDCGYAAPGARMQYSGGSFAGIAAAWFSWILQPQRRLRRPRGVMPDGALRVERTPDTVLESVIGPLTTGTLRISTWVRRLQQGRLQYYIIYLLAGIVALAVMVLLGAPS